MTSPLELRCATHPIASLQLFPALDAATEDALRDSIARFGVLVPVLVDQHGRTIDGHHRSRIARELEVPFEPMVHQVVDDEHAASIAREVNLHRRHLDPAQRREVVAALAEQGHTQAAIADALRVDRRTVRDDLAEQCGDTPTLPETVTRRDGRSYPRQLRPRTQREASPPHVGRASGENEWYTPPSILEPARRVLGGIDLDPASSDVAQRTVQAGRYFTVADDGLAQPWAGTVWLNPPYATTLVGRFVDKLLEEFAGEVTAAVVLVNNATETAWAQKLLRAAASMCFLAGRVRYLDANGEPANTPLQGQMLIHLTRDWQSLRRFPAEFNSLGTVLTP